MKDGIGYVQRFGFRWNSLSVQRQLSTLRWGSLLAIVTPRKVIEIRVTPSGLIRIGKTRKPAKHEIEEYNSAPIR